MAELYGTKRVFGGAILVGAILSFFTPMAARTHYILLILLRALIGLVHVRLLFVDAQERVVMIKI